MSTIVAYESMYGNSERVARAVAAGIGEVTQVCVCDIADVHTNPALLDGAQLVVAGGPTHAFGMTRPTTRAEAVRKATGDVSGRSVGLREWIDGLSRRSNRPMAATFDTRASRAASVPGSAARSAARALRRAGFTLVTPATSFYVTDVEGPLVDGELDRAREWGRSLAAIVGERRAAVARD